MLVCWDQWYPEAARLTALSGAQILFYPTAIGWLPAEKAGARGAAAARLGDDPAEPRHRQRRLRRARSTAWARGRPAPAASSSGAGPSSADPGVGVLVRGGDGRGGAVTATCDLAKVDASRTHWPFLRDRRIDAYADITRRYLD